MLTGPPGNIAGVGLSGLALAASLGQLGWRARLHGTNKAGECLEPQADYVLKSLKSKSRN
jgi:hypothetical protein